MRVRVHKIQCWPEPALLTASAAIHSCLHIPLAQALQDIITHCGITGMSHTLMGPVTGDAGDGSKLWAGSTGIQELDCHPGIRAGSHSSDLHAGACIMSRILCSAGWHPVSLRCPTCHISVCTNKFMVCVHCPATHSNHSSEARQASET